MKTYAKLGFSHLETKEIVENLNILLANYHIHYQKLRNFHWNVEGPDFFDLHQKFEEQYNEVKLNIDAVAERIRVFGKKPQSTLREYLETAGIEETSSALTSREMMQEVLYDFEKLISYMMDVIGSANRIGDTGTVDMVTKFIRRMEKKHWMYSSWLKQERVYETA